MTTKRFGWLRLLLEREGFEVVMADDGRRVVRSSRAGAVRRGHCRYFRADHGRSANNQGFPPVGAGSADYCRFGVHVPGCRNAGAGCPRHGDQAGRGRQPSEAVPTSGTPHGGRDVRFRSQRNARAGDTLATAGVAACRLNSQPPSSTTFSPLDRYSATMQVICCAGSERAGEFRWFPIGPNPRTLLR